MCLLRPFAHVCSLPSWTWLWHGDEKGMATRSRGGGHRFIECLLVLVRRRHTHTQCHLVQGRLEAASPSPSQRPAGRLPALRRAREWPWDPSLDDGSGRSPQ